MPFTEREALLTSSGSVELLAPAGGPEALVAAVANGADAVYLGLGAFNARRGATNFEAATFAGWVRFAHLRGVRVYLTANIVVLPSEIREALELIDLAWAAGVDAVIVQDLGMLRLLRQLLPDVRVHGSTQIGTMNPEAVHALAGLGVRRVTLARELSLDAIAACASAGIEVESFVHGALCYSYSGQCLMSSLIGQRSANRGLCAQPCRLQYDLIDSGGEVVATPGRHLLSTKDLAGISQLPALVGAGVSALKIEGRMKSPEYVAIVTSVYRAALDRALADPASYEVLPSEWQRLEEAFSRGFTDAYLTGERGRALMSYTRPNNRGVLIGRVGEVGPGIARLPLERSLDPADTLQFWTRSGHFTQTAGELRVGTARVSGAPAGETVTLAVEQPVASGDRVFRVADATLLEAARRTFSGDADDVRLAVPADIAVKLRIGEPLEVRVSVSGAEGSAQGERIAPARTKAVGADEVIAHVGRLGGSGYRAASWQVDLDAGAGVGYSQLHAVRRAAIDRLDEARLAAYSDRVRRHPEPPSLRSHTRRHPAAPAIVATTWDAETAVACVEAGAGEVWLRVFPGSPAQAMPDAVRPLLPRVVWPDDLSWLGPYLDGGMLLAGELGSLRSAAEAGKVQADWPLNALNAHAVETLHDLGASFVWLSPELSGRQMAEVAAVSRVPVGCVVWGRTEVMVTEQCVLMAAGACGRRCASCPRRDGWWRLRDQKGYEFPVTTDTSGRSHVMNSVTLDLSRSLDEVVASGVAAVRLDFADEGPDTATAVVRAMIAAVARIAAGGPPPAEALIAPATSGHLHRGLK
ncbi:MAG: U32 family peptidase [Coriobacteriia bacterium]|nr:U32 family peptidase [Coriobacteriia bacterium]